MSDLTPTPIPVFRYHPDPLRSGSVVSSTAKCRCCKKVRGHLYTGPVYSEETLEDALCPWCIADGSAHKKFDATFVDTEAFPADTPDTVVDEITQRTPGYRAWQSEAWPACCGDATQYLGAYGIKELRAHLRDQEGAVLSHIIYDMKISGGAALRLLESLDKDTGPTLHLFHCPRCLAHRFHIDRP